MLTVQVTGLVWAGDTHGRCMVRSLAVPSFDVMSTMNYTQKESLLF